ncbi:MAG: hypothetical protein KC800_25430 [Candidatus Eremiobacteraeota bacterium]|nr:hypothetical protein [Candidatus Eremiobacteraeota bacterium]
MPEQSLDLDHYYQRARELDVSAWKNDRWKQFEVRTLEAIRGKWGELIRWLDQQEARLHKAWEESSLTGLAETILEEGLQTWLEALEEIRFLAQERKFEYDLFELAEDGQRLVSLAARLQIEPERTLQPCSTEVEEQISTGALLEAFAA